MAEVTGVKVNELPKKTAYDESDLIYVVGNGVDLKMEMKDLKRNVAPDVFSGATELTPGEKGLVPTPTVTDSNKVLGGDGEWKELAPVATSGDFDDLNNKPEITEVEANPTDTPTAELEKITIGTTTYSILSSKVYGEANGDLITIEDAMEAPLEECKVTLEPQQDLNGYEYPWVGGAGKNKINADDYFSEYKTSAGVYRLTGGMGAGIKLYIPSNLIGEQLTFSAYVDLTKEASPSRVYARAYVNEAQINGNDINLNTKGVTSVTFTPTATTDYVLLTFGSDGMRYYEIDWIQLEIGSTTTDYAPYSNICPISGWTECKVQRTGKNLFDIHIDKDTAYTNVILDKPLDQTFTVSAVNNNVAVSETVWRIGFVYKNNEIYYVGDNGYQRPFPQTIIATKLNPIVKIQYRGTTMTSGSYDVQVELGSQPTTYEPYNGQTYTIQLGDTYYGGELDVKSGVLKVTDGYIASYNGETLPSTWISDRDVYAPNTSPTTGAEVVYKLATPTEVTLTPTEVTLLRGINNLWSDGEMYIKYRRDLDIFLNKLEARVRALEEG